jgi:hypothetical protein
MTISSRGKLMIASGVIAAIVLIAGTALFATRAHGKSPAATQPAALNSAVVPRTSENVRVAAAKLLNTRYGLSRLAAWNVRVHAAGTDCRVLLVQTGVVLDDSMVEAMHYGIGSYVVYEGGVQRYYMERDFRGVVYRDASGRNSAFGSVPDSEVEALELCP